MAAAAPREALLLRLGALAPRLRQPHRRRLVEDALDLLRGASRIRLFALPNADLVAVAPVGTERLRDAEAALRTLLAADGEGAPPVARLRLPEEAAALFAAVEAALVPDASRRAAASRGAAGPAARRDAAAFTAEDLAAMERGLAGADLSAFLRQRPVCRLGSGDAGAGGGVAGHGAFRCAAVFAALAPPGGGRPGGLLALAAAPAAPDARPPAPGGAGAAGPRGGAGRRRALPVARERRHARIRALRRGARPGRAGGGR